MKNNIFLSLEPKSNIFFNTIYVFYLYKYLLKLKINNKISIKLK